MHAYPSTVYLFKNWKLLQPRFGAVRDSQQHQTSLTEKSLLSKDGGKIIIAPPRSNIQRDQSNDPDQLREHTPTVYLQ
jgi:hypothetical protein